MFVVSVPSATAMDCGESGESGESEADDDDGNHDEREMMKFMIGEINSTYLSKS